MRWLATVLAASFLTGSGAARPADALRFAAEPAWSPDSRSIAFSGVLASGRQSVFVAALDGSAPAEVAEGTTPAFARDGRIGFLDGGTGPTGHPGQTIDVGPPGGPFKGVGATTGADNLCFSSSGRWIAYDDYLSAGSTKTDGSGEGASLGDSSFSPVCGPRGDLVAVSQAGLLTMRADGTRIRRLTRGEDQPSDWSRRGGWIVFTRSGYVEVIAAAGGKPRRLARGSSATISPGGARVAYVSRIRALVVVGADGRRPRTIARGRVERPEWSPDGRWLAFVAARRLELVHPDGTGRRVLAP